MSSSGHLALLGNQWCNCGATGQTLLLLLVHLVLEHLKPGRKACSLHILLVGYYSRSEYTGVFVNTGLLMLIGSWGHSINTDSIKF